MKKVLLSLTVLALFGTATQAQEAKTTMSSGGTTFGVKVGVGFQNIIGDDALGKKVNYEMGIKWNAGVNAEIPVATGFYFQPGLSLATKGAKIDATTGTSATPETRFNLYYLDVPMTFLYKAGSSAGKFLVGFGPYIGFGIGGKVIRESGANGSDTETDVEYRGSYTAADALANPKTLFLKRIEGGANALVGYEFSNKFSVMVNAQLGLTKINSNLEGVTDNTALKNIGFGLNFGYRFGK